MMRIAQILLSLFYSTVFTTENINTIPFATPRTTDELIDITFTAELVQKHVAKSNNFSLQAQMVSHIVFSNLGRLC